MNEHVGYKAQWLLKKFVDREKFLAGESFEEMVIDGNALLNEGINALQLLLTGGSATAFNNTNSFLGVGDSATAVVATQTGLQASSNKLYKAMEPGYPQISGQTTTFRSVFAGNDANFAWQEMSVANGNSDAAVNLNRKVSNQGTKIAGQVWTLDLAITFS